MTFKQFLAEEPEFWSSYPNLPTSKRFAQGLKADLAEKFKWPTSRISVKQYLPATDTFRQRWTVKLPKKTEDIAELTKSLVGKFLVQDLERFFDNVQLTDSWVAGDKSYITLVLLLKKKLKL